MRRSPKELKTDTFPIRVFILVVIFRTNKIDMIWIIVKILFIVLNGANTACAKSLVILLLQHEEDATHKIIWIHDRHWQRILLMMQIIGSVTIKLDDRLEVIITVERIKTEILT